MKLIQTKIYARMIKTQDFLAYDLPYAIDITLYKHNYYDRLIISYLKKYARYESIPLLKDSFIVEISDFKEIIDTKFSNEINSLQALTEIEIGRNVNSIFFINKLINNFHNLKYIKVNISNKRKFTRLVEIDKNKTLINFDYKILTSVIDLTAYFNKKSEYKNINNLFKKIGLIKDDPFGCKISYIKTTSQHLMELLSIFESNMAIDTDADENFNNEYIEAIDFIYNLIDRKIALDNSNLIIVTDFVD